MRHIVAPERVRRALSDKLTTKRALVAIVGVLLALAWAVPSIGASTAKLARKALSRANLAVYKSDLAVDSSNKAKASAADAGVTASSAKSAATQAQTTADQALSKANGIVQSSFARMNQPCTVSSACNMDHARGVTAIRQASGTGAYCVTVPGRSPSTATWLASVDAGDTGTAADAQAVPASGSPDCNSGEFEVRTARAGTGASDVAFFVAIP